MKMVTLTRGMYAFVDDADYGLVKDYKWRSHKEGGAKISYYSAVANTCVDGKRGSLRMSRLIMGLNKDDRLEVDHINGNPLDNRRINLRLATHAENCRNRGASKNSSSKYKGVSWDKSVNKWIVQICINGKNINIGRSRNETFAASMYDEKARELHGEFAQTNFSESL